MMDVLAHEAPLLQAVFAIVMLVPVIPPVHLIPPGSVGSQLTSLSKQSGRNQESPGASRVNGVGFFTLETVGKKPRIPWS
jgi:hypothetical protein